MFVSDFDIYLYPWIKDVKKKKSQPKKCNVCIYFVIFLFISNHVFMLHLSYIQLFYFMINFCLLLISFVYFLDILPLHIIAYQ